MNTIAWKRPTTPLPMENNPQVVFERLFGDGQQQRRAPFAPENRIEQHSRFGARMKWPP